VDSRGRTIFVADAAAPMGGNGSSWGDALGDPAEALRACFENASSTLTLLYRRVDGTDANASSFLSNRPRRRMEPNQVAGAGSQIWKRKNAAAEFHIIGTQGMEVRIVLIAQQW
jgi:hypothetical protein